MENLSIKSSTDNKPEILISSCLIGCPVRYDGSSSEVDGLRNLVEEGKAIDMCPELAVGLPIPRKPTEIEPGKTAKEVIEGTAKILDEDGNDYTQEFIDGAEELLKVCKEKGIKTVILKDNSPSCGVNKVFDGTFSGNKIPGQGVTAELLNQNGITVYSEHDFPKELL